MKKVCIVDFDFSVCGGVERVSAALANALADRYEVHLVSLCMKDKSLAFPLDERVKYRNLLEGEGRLRAMRKAIKPMLRGYFKENKIDVAIIQGNYPGFLVSTTCKGVGTKLVFVDHGALMNQWDRKDIRFIRWISSFLCERTAALTEQSRCDYVKRFHLKDKKVKCIYNWIEDGIFKSEKYAADSKRIISAGRLGHEKGFSRLIEVFEPVAKAHPDWHLDIYGDGEMREEVEGLIKEKKLLENVHLMGQVNDLEKRYKDYAMYVLPSDREGMPLVLLEAKSNRLPIVSFDIMTGPNEIVRDGVDGYLIPPYDTKEMAKAINKLIEDDKLRQEMSDASQENLEKFSKRKILGDWVALIEEISK